jgi:hypothetical protein
MSNPHPIGTVEFAAFNAAEIERNRTAALAAREAQAALPDGFHYRDAAHEAAERIRLAKLQSERAQRDAFNSIKGA